MGKSTTASMFHRRKIPVFDADKVVHNLFNRDGPVLRLVEKHFPSAVTDNRVDRAVLGKIVFGDPNRLCILESIIHPLVDIERKRFLQSHRRGKTKMVVLDIPLFFCLIKQRDMRQKNSTEVILFVWYQRRVFYRDRGLWVGLA